MVAAVAVEASSPDMDREIQAQKLCLHLQTSPGSRTSADVKLGMFAIGVLSGREEDKAMSLISDQRDMTGSFVTCSKTHVLAASQTHT